MITLQQNQFQIPGAWTYRAKGAPDRKYVASQRIWLLPNSLPNRKYLLGNFLATDFDPAALQAATATEAAPKPVSVPMPEWPPGLLPHQEEALNLAWGKEAFFFAHDMGAGKSRTLLELWRGYFNAGLINEAWVICPNSLTDNWVDQINKWVPELKDLIKIYGILSLSAGSLPIELVKRSHKRLAVAVDESQRIKNSQAKRTRVMAEIGKNCAFRANLTGTDITKGIEDLYSQYNFLDPNILGYKSFFAFRNRYCMMGGFENKQIVGYQNMAELMQLIAPHTHKVIDPVKLPPQSRETRMVSLAPEQKRLLAELKSQMQTEMAGNRITADNALVYYTRGAQILGGFFPLADGGVMRLPTNNKLTELVEIIEGTSKKVVVFCRFIPEMNMITETLREKGIKTLQIRAKDPTLQDQVKAFQEDDEHQVIVSTYAMGSVGFTLTRGKILVEYSGTFNYEESVQARKRIHRIGQEDQTKVIRLMAVSKLDQAIQDIADRKKTIADFVNDSLTNPKALLEILE